MPEPLAPTGPDLGRRNRRLIAERTGWPVGAIDACENIEQKFPEWRVSHLRENSIPHFERPAGFYASRARSLGQPEARANGATPDALITAIEAENLLGAPREYQARLHTRERLAP